MTGKIILHNKSEIEFNGEDKYISENEIGVRYINKEYNKETYEERFYPWSSIERIDRYYQNLDSEELER